MIIFRQSPSLVALKSIETLSKMLAFFSLY